MNGNFARGASIVFCYNDGKNYAEKFLRFFGRSSTAPFPTTDNVKWGGRARPERSYHISRPISGAATTVMMPASIITKLDTTPSCGPSS